MRARGGFGCQVRDLAAGLKLPGKNRASREEAKVAFAKAAALLREASRDCEWRSSDGDHRAAREDCVEREHWSVRRDRRRRAHWRRYANRRALRDWSGMLDWRQLPHSSARHVVCECSHRPIAWKFIPAQCWARTDSATRTAKAATGNFRKRASWKLATTSKSARTRRLIAARSTTRASPKE